MSQWIDVADADDLPAGSGREYAVAGRIVAVYHVDGTLHAIDGICAHAGGPLGEGTLEGSIVTCPWHGWQYDVTTGRHCLTPQIVQRSYPVKLEAGRVLIEVDEDV